MIGRGGWLHRRFRQDSFQKSLLLEVLRLGPPQIGKRFKNGFAYNLVLTIRTRKKKSPHIKMKINLPGFAHLLKNKQGNIFKKIIMKK